MRASALVVLLLSAASTSASASRHEIKVQVLSTQDQHVSGINVGTGPSSVSPYAPGGEGASTTICPLTYPDGSDSLAQCVIQGAPVSATGTAQARSVHAILTTQDGLTYFAVIDCQRQYGWCMPLVEHATYVGLLNDRSKRLDHYQPSQGWLKITLRPDGKKKVTYQINSAVQVKLIHDSPAKNNP